MTLDIKRLIYSSFAAYDHVEAENDQERFLQSMSQRRCPLCDTPYRHFAEASSSALREHALPPGVVGPRRMDLLLCPACGWWHLSRQSKMINPKSGMVETALWYQLHHAVYAEVALNSSTLPIEDLRRHLTRFWADRKHITAQQAEDLVASLLRDHYGGDVTKVTANANAPDGGIDLMIVADGGLVRRAVQVKRRIAQDVEPIEDVRNFIGALVLAGSDSGTFATTASRFTREAAKVAANGNLTRKKLNVDLIDGEKMLELLDFSNRQVATKLPPDMDLDGEWQDDNGATITTRSLLFSDLSRLFPK